MVLDVHSGTLPQWPGYQKAAALCPVNRFPVYQTRQCLANSLSVIIAARVCCVLGFPHPKPPRRGTAYAEIVLHLC